MNNKYIGKNCPFCKAPFTLYDDIVVCSQCDMPHHRDCWVENGACTTFGCLGNIKNVSNTINDSVTSEFMDFEISFDSAPQNSQQNFVYCVKCGAANKSENAFCVNCGSPIASATNQQNYYSNYSNPQNSYSNQQGYSQYNPYGQQNNYQNNYQNYQNYQNNYSQNYSQNYNTNGYAQNNYANNDPRLEFVGTNQYYYSQKFSEMTLQNKNSSWNWCAFLFAPWWFIYRKMYAWGFGYLGISLLLTVLPKWGIILFLSLAAPITARILFGVFGNNIYMKHLNKLVSEGATYPPTVRPSFVSRKGGVNLGALVGTLVAYPFVLILLLIIFWA